MKHYKKGGRYISPAVWILAAGGFFLLFSIFFNLARNINQPDVFGMNLFIGKASAISMALSTVLLTAWLALYIIGGGQEADRILCQEKAV